MEVEHLKMIQAVIERMARNSFLLKGWSATATSALLGLAAADTDRTFAVIAAALALVLAVLDGYYLALERSYRSLYDEAAANRVAAWRLTANPVTIADLLDAVVSPSVVLLHGCALAAAAAVIVAGP